VVIDGDGDGDVDMEVDDRSATARGGKLLVGVVAMLTRMV
jgi:hypothetical protein